MCIVVSTEFMGRFIRWQAILAVTGAILLVAYLQTIVVKKITVEVPAEGGTYREGNLGSVQFINPLLAEYNPIDVDITGLVFEGLTRAGADAELYPVLAQNWSVSEDGRVYVFVLRPDVRWSDGEPFTAADVVFTLNLIRADDFPGNPALRDLWQSVKIEQVDDLTIRFTLEDPFPSFPYFTTTGILPRHLLKGIAARDLLIHPFNLSPVGTGPFRVQDVAADHVLLARNPRYRGQSSRIEQVEFLFFPTTDALLEAWKTDAIDGIGQMPAELIAPLQALPDARLFSAPLPQFSVVYLNLQKADDLPFFQNPDVRRALLMLIDRQGMIDTVLHGQGVVANSPFLAWQWAFNPNQSFPEFDPAAADELLANAGWVDTDGDGIRDDGSRPLAFALTVSDNPRQQQVAQYLAAAWRKAGIAVDVSVNADNLSAQLKNRAFDAVLVNVELFGDPDPYRFWDQAQIDGGQNYGGWNNSEASIALENGRISRDKNERIKDYYIFQQIFAQETPALVLYNPIFTYALRHDVKNVQMSPLASTADRFSTIQNWYLLTNKVIETKAFAQ